MTKEEMIAIALEEGFVKACLIDTDQLVFHHEFREFCAQNYCGNYNNNYACPPRCGTPQEMEDRIMKYKKAIVFQSRTPVENIMDDAETKVIKKEHTAKTLRVLKKYYGLGMSRDGVSAMAGPCNYCERCKALDDEPCVNDGMRFSCLSAYCLDAAQMAKTCEMEMTWNGDVVSFFSVYAFDEA